jgi:Predicted nucleotidyltransferase
MLARIIQTLKQIEEEENVKIIYACESGSRAWGFESTDSDYDVRFIYIRPINWYLSIYDKRDVIEKPISDSLDINGWDVRKALQLLKKSNPPLLEWLRSPILYTEDISCIQPMKGLVTKSFSPQSCIYHYLSMAKGNYREHLQGDTIWTKKYFYVLRPILACKWIEAENTIPPVKFDILLKTLLDDGPLMKEIDTLLK